MRAENATREASAEVQLAVARANRAEASLVEAETMRGAVMSEVEGLRATLKKVTAEYSGKVREGEELRAALSREVDQLRGDAQDARASLAAIREERNALLTRATVAEIEVGKAKNVVAGLTTEALALRAAKVSADHSKMAMVSALRAQLAEEQAARHEWLSNAGGDTVERVKRQREKSTELSMPKITTTTSAASIPSSSSKTLHRTTTNVSSTGVVGKRDGSSTVGIPLPSQAALVREALKAAGLDEALADEYVAAAAVKNSAIKSGGGSASGGGRNSHQPLSPGEEALVKAQEKARARLVLQQTGENSEPPILDGGQLAAAWERPTTLPPVSS